MVNLFELINETKTVRCAKRFLQKRKNIPKKKLCRNGHQMTLYISESDSRHCRWRCKLRKCRQEIGIRTNNWLQGSGLAFDKFLLFIYFRCENKTSINFCKKELDMSPSSVVDISSYLHEIFADKFLKNSQKIDGEGQVVEVDESLLTRRKNQVSRVLPSTWVVGGICRETKKVSLTVSPDRSAPSIMTAIEIYV